MLLVDATQGVQAQTIANVNLAMANNHVIIPVINKIDLASADVENTKHSISEVLMLEASRHPDQCEGGPWSPRGARSHHRANSSPSGDPQAPLKALIFDSWFDNYQGVIVLTRVVDGAMRPGMKIKVMSNGRTFEVMEVGHFTPKRIKKKAELLTGEVGYLCANMKEVADVKIGDTITDAVQPTAEPFPGYKEVKPLVFCGLYSTDTAKYEDLRDALIKLRLNDSSFVYEPETSLALGFGFRCGFLGLLHMEIIQERLEREYGLTLITTALHCRVPCRPPRVRSWK